MVILIILNFVTVMLRKSIFLFASEVSFSTFSVSLSVSADATLHDTMISKRVHTFTVVMFLSHVLHKAQQADDLAEIE